MKTDGATSEVNMTNHSQDITKKHLQRQLKISSHTQTVSKFGLELKPKKLLRHTYLQKQPPEVFCKNFIKRETPAQVFSCEFFEISKNTSFTEHLWATASKSSAVGHCFLNKTESHRKIAQTLSYV